MAFHPGGKHGAQCHIPGKLVAALEPVLPAAVAIWLQTLLDEAARLAG